MVYKIGTIADISKLPPLEKHFEMFLTNCARDLTKAYGTERNIDNDDGGYLLYVEKGTSHDEIKNALITPPIRLNTQIFSMRLHVPPIC